MPTEVDIEEDWVWVVLLFVTLVEDSVLLLWELVNFWEADDRVRTFLGVVLVEVVERHVSVPQEFWSIIDEVCLVYTGL